MNLGGGQQKKNFIIYWTAYYAGPLSHEDLRNFTYGYLNSIFNQLKQVHDLIAYQHKLKHIAVQISLLSLMTF